jgi:hypothetical protein
MVSNLQFTRVGTIMGRLSTGPSERPQTVRMQARIIGMPVHGRCVTDGAFPPSGGDRPSLLARPFLHGAFQPSIDCLSWRSLGPITPLRSTVSV